MEYMAVQVRPPRNWAQMSNFTFRPLSLRRKEVGWTAELVWMENCNKTVIIWNIRREIYTTKTKPKRFTNQWESGAVSIQVGSNEEGKDY
jgi:hypothetical protein